MAHDVFISYSSKDKTIADAVCAGMEKEGIRCWIAPRDILPSENYDDAIIRALNSARVMVVIFSSRIFTSQFVKSEVERGFSKGLTIAPFRIENVDPEGGLELYLGRRHWLDAITPPLEAHIHTLAVTVGSILGEARLDPAQNLPAVETVSQKVEIPPKSKFSPGAKIGLAAVLSIIGLGVVSIALILGFMLFKLASAPPIITSSGSMPTSSPGSRPVSPSQTAPPNSASQVTSSPGQNLTEAVSNPDQPTSQPAPAALTPSTNSSSAIPYFGVWQQVLDLPRQVNRIVVDPTHPKTLYAGVGVSYQGGVYKSEDGGLTWHNSSKGLPNLPVNALTLVLNPGPVVLASPEENELYASKDGGSSWTSLGYPMRPGNDVLGFVVSMHSKSALANGRVNGLIRTNNAGQSWTLLGDGLPVAENGTSPLLASIALDPNNPSVVYAGTGGGGLGQGQGVYKSTDGGASFSASNRGMLDYQITALAVDPHQSQVVYAGCWDGHLFKSTDGGASWNGIERPLMKYETYLQQIRDIQIDVDIGTVYLLIDKIGILYSQDGGTKWLSIGMPAGFDQPNFSSMTFVPGDKPAIFLAAYGLGAWKLAPAEQ